MGDFGYLLSCLTIDMREKVSASIYQVILTGNYFINMYMP